MRIVLLSNDSGERPGEASRPAARLLAEALRPLGIDAGVVVPEAPVPADEALLAALRRPQGWAALTRHWRALRRAAEAEFTAGADLFHAHSWFPAGVAVPAGAPFVITAYAADAAMLRASRLVRRLTRPIFERAAVVSAVSREVADVVQNITGRHVSHAHVQAMPVDTTRWPWSTGGGGAVVVAPLVASQRIELAIHAVAVLASCGHGLPLTIIGDGPRRNELMRFAHLNGVDTLVHFVSGASPDDIFRYITTADLMLHPAQADPRVPWVLAAILTGVPVVACWDGGGVVDLVAETGPGRLTLPSLEALSDAALGVMMDTSRFELARLVGQGWRARVAPDQVAEVAAQWYREALTVPAQTLR